jgi:hypothetical protein
MSELATQNTARTGVRWQLLATVSALALATGVVGAQAGGDEPDRPIVWIDLGGQLERIDTAQSAFAPPFLTQTPTPEPYLNGGSPLLAQRQGRYAMGGEGKVVIQPKGSDWVFAAGVRYGRATSRRNIQHQSTFSTPFPNPKYVTNPTANPTKLVPVTAQRLAFSKTRNQDTYAIVDFQAGRDVGLGIRGMASTISAGVRYAAFDAKSDARITARPSVEITAFPFPILPGIYLPVTKHDEFFLAGHASRSFHGVGPSLSWNASAPLTGSADDGEIDFDWGLNGAVLFGRQKVSGTHQITAVHKSLNLLLGTIETPLYAPGKLPFGRSRSVVVPNIGAFAGLSFRYVDAKVSFGYRADYFFGAMDVGIDARKTSDRGFHGPFAKISIGLGG